MPTDDLPSGAGTALRAPVSTPTPQWTPARPYDLEALGSPASTRHQGADWHRYFDILKRRWRTIAVVAAVITGGTAIGTWLDTPTYRATGLIELRGKGAEVTPVEALFESERLSAQFLETQYGVLRSTALANMVIRDLGKPLFRELDVPTRSRPDSNLIANRALEAFAKRLIVDPVSGSNLVRVHFEAADPELAAQAVNATFAKYTELQSETGRVAVKRLAAQVDTIRGRLATAERQLLGFSQENNLDVLETERGASISLPHERLRTLESKLTDSEAERYAKESRYRLAESENDDLLDSDVLRSLTVRLASLRGEYAKLLATFHEDYPRTLEVKQQIDEQEALLRRERARIRGEIAGEYEVAMRRQQLLRSAVDSQRRVTEGLSERSTQYRILTREVEAQRQLYAMLQQKLRGSQVSAAVAGTDVHVLGLATVPVVPVRPVPARDIPLALLVGLLLGVGVAFVREYADGSIRTVEEVDDLEIRVLGAIPMVRRQERAQLRPREVSRVISALAGSSTSAGEGELVVPRIDVPSFDTLTDAALQDAFSSLRTAVLLNGRPGGVRSLLITSAQPGDGKTTIAINLALSLTRLGRRVLLIDADTRRPGAHRMLGIAAEVGLRDYLAGSIPWEGVVHTNASPGLDLLPAGLPMRAPTELLASPRMATLIEQAEAVYDFVIVDSPALLINAADTRIVAPLVDGVIVVIRSGSTSRTMVHQMLRHVPNLAGVVLNQLESRYFPDYYTDDATSASSV